MRACVHVCVQVCACACTRVHGSLCAHVCAHVYVCMCLCFSAHVYMCTCTCACVCVCVHVCICARFSAHTRAHMYVCTCTRFSVRACVHACVYVRTRVHACVHACVHMRVCWGSCQPRDAPCAPLGWAVWDVMVVSSSILPVSFVSEGAWWAQGPLPGVHVSPSSRVGCQLTRLLGSPAPRPSPGPALFSCASRSFWGLLQTPQGCYLLVAAPGRGRRTPTTPPLCGWAGGGWSSGWSYLQALQCQW